MLNKKLMNAVYMCQFNSSADCRDACDAQCQRHAFYMTSCYQCVRCSRRRPELTLF